MMRAFEELVAKAEDAAWPLVADLVRAAPNAVELLPPPQDPAVRRATLVATQVTTRSPMGAIAYETGGILVDHGWVRVLGGGHPRFSRTLPGWNVARSDGFYLIGDDALGGFFAINGGAFGGAMGRVWYHAPDSLRWEVMAEMGYSEWLRWLMAGDLKVFYENLRWPGWREEIAAVGADQVLNCYPPLWTAEGRDIATANRRAVPIAEAYGLNLVDLPRQLG